MQQLLKDKFHSKLSGIRAIKGRFVGGIGGTFIGATCVWVEPNSELSAVRAPPRGTAPHGGVIGGCVRTPGGTRAVRSLLVQASGSVPRKHAAVLAYYSGHIRVIGFLPELDRWNREKEKKKKGGRERRGGLDLSLGLPARC